VTAVEVGALLSRRISVAMLLVLGALWLSGALWLVLHFFMATPGEFGATHHPLEAPVLMIHGLVALLALFVLGWFTARHSVAARSGQRRASGWWLAIVMAVLVPAGCLQLFLVDETARSVLSLVHEVLGASLVVPVLAHGGWLGGRVRASMAPGKPSGGVTHDRTHGYS
jgi:hypothetical protein